MAAYAGTWRPRLGKMIDATPPVVWHCPITSGLSILPGDFVVRTTGLVVTLAQAGTLTLGIAMEPAPTAAGDIAVLVATGQTLFSLPVHHGTVGSSDIEEANMGVSTYDLAYVTLPYWYIDKEGTAAVNVTIHQFKDAVGTVNGIVLASVNYDHREVV